MIQLASAVYGDGPPLVLLHGFTGSGASMKPLGTQLADRRTVHALDLPGHGATPISEDLDDYTMLSTVTAIVSYLDRHDLSSADVVGYSMGGRIALGLAVIAPVRVDRLAIIGATAGIDEPAMRATRVRFDEDLAQKIVDQGIEWFVDHWMSRPIFASQARLGSQALARARADRLTNDPLGLSLSLRGIGTGAQPNLFGRLDRVASPTLVLAGEEDTKFIAVGEQLVRGLPSAELAVVPESGHATHLENPEATAALVLDHLETSDR